VAVTHLQTQVLVAVAVGQLLAALQMAAQEVLALSSFVTLNHNKHQLPRQEALR
jgi:hypothetical protein